MKSLYALTAALLLSACFSPPKPAIARSEASGTASGATTVAAPGGAASSAQPAATAPTPLAEAAPASPAPANSLAGRPDVQEFIEEMVTKHHFKQATLEALFARAQAQPAIIATITRPAEAKPWYAYRKIFLVPRRIRGGVEFWRAHEAALARAEQVYGVPAEVIVAILGVETLYGGNTGSYRVLEALSTLAFDYPPRAAFFRKELEQFLLLAREEGIDPLSLQGSYAGAMGLAQFMPSSYRAYAVDFDGDRHRDLWRNPADAIGSIASYLGTHGWQTGEAVAIPARVDGHGYRTLLGKDLKPKQSVQTLRRRGIIPEGPVDNAKPAVLLELEGETSAEYWLGFDNFYVITRYNRSPLYAMAVYQLSQEIRKEHKS